MSAAARRRVPKPEIIQQTLEDQEFLKSLERCLVSAADKVYAPTNPYYIPAYVGQNMYFNAVHFASQELRNRGFKLVWKCNQLRLCSDSNFACPMTLTFWGGALANGIVTFRWPRGFATKQLVRLNQLSYRPLQPNLFQQDFSGENTLQQLHLGVVHDVSYYQLKAWLVVAVNWLDSKTLECAEWAEICRRQFDRQSIPDIAPPMSNDSDYFIDFGESLTGT
jgi:hypothetical protein